MSKNKKLPDGIWQEANGKIHMTRCPKCGRENYIVNVSSGICTWCGFNAKELIEE